MRAPANRRVHVVGYAAATPLGSTLEASFARAAAGEAGFRKLTRCRVDCASDIVGEIPDWDPHALDFASQKDVHQWNAAVVLLTMAVCRDALRDAGLELTAETAPRTACLIGSALNGHDAYRTAVQALSAHGPNRVSPFLLPNLCGNVPAGKAGMLLGFTGPVFSPQGACASGNHAIGLGARLIRDGDCDFVLAGGVDMPILPELVHGFANMNATIKVRRGDRAWDHPDRASRPFSIDRKGFVLAEGAGVLVLAADDAVAAHGLRPRAEVLGIGWTSDAHHFTRPHPPAIVRAMREALDDAGLAPHDVQYVNAHATSTPQGDAVEVDCLREVFGARLARLPVSSSKSQLGHTLGAAAAIEAALTIEGMRRGLLLPTINHLPDPALDGLDVVPNVARRQHHELALSNAFGFGGTNCCVVFRGE
ncbi:MAG: beta-ketoacyl-[acyl-carrier-protein] synthase family protein [Deltaproteobacteria bacterium]|nr:beta-ketoacyl-[acyl-carrier-protein] synthase family protein [Deltaproteobacteria bacterium]